MGGQGYGLGGTLPAGTTGGIQAPRSRVLSQRVKGGRVWERRIQITSLDLTRIHLRGFRTLPAALGSPSQLHVMDEPLFGVFSDPEGGSRALLRKLLASTGKLPPVQECLVGRVLQGVPKRQLPRLDHLQSGSDLEVDAAYTQSRY